MAVDSVWAWIVCQDPREKERTPGKEWIYTLLHFIDHDARYYSSPWCRHSADCNQNSIQVTSTCSLLSLRESNERSSCNCCCLRIDLGYVANASVWLLFGRNSEARPTLGMDWHPSASHSPFLQSTSHERSCQLKSSTAVPRLDCELSIRGEQVLCTDHHCGLTTQHWFNQKIFHELHRVSKTGLSFARY
jgi:hypothetical protein